MRFDWESKTVHDPWGLRLATDLFYVVQIGHWYVKRPHDRNKGDDFIETHTHSLNAAHIYRSVREARLAAESHREFAKLNGVKVRVLQLVVSEV